MSTLLMAAMLATVGADQPGAKGAEGAMPQVEGKWLIVYAEEGSRRMNSWEQRVVTIKDNTLSYERDGKEQTIRLKFGPHQSLKASADGKEEGASGGEGVYIAGQDYLCLSLATGHFGGDKGSSARPQEGQGTSSGSFILILRRQR
jgi:hypothetical protein